MKHQESKQEARSKRSPEETMDENEGFEDQLWYLELKFGVELLSFQCLVKSDGPKIYRNESV